MRINDIRPVSNVDNIKFKKLPPKVHECDDCIFRSDSKCLKRNANVKSINRYNGCIYYKKVETNYIFDELLHQEIERRR